MKITVVSLILLAVTSSSWAAESGPYLYGALGTSKSDRKAETDATISNLGITAFTSTADDTDTAYKLQLGWSFNSNLAIEGGYVDFGRYTYGAVSTAPIAATRDGHLDASGWTLGVVGSLPITDDLAVFAKVGAIAWDVDFGCGGTGIACVNPDRSDDGVSGYFGVGGTWAFSPAWFLRAEYEVFQDVGTAFNSTGTTGTSEESVKMGSIGIGYRF